MRKTITRKQIDDGRIAHMHGVAEYMYKHALEYSLDPVKMYILGLVHDIGYVSGEKEEHEAYGASVLQEMFSADNINLYCDIIRWHGTTPEEYIDQKGCSEDDIPRELILLWDADMHVDLSGKDVGYAKRIRGIASKYGMFSKQYDICEQTITWLIRFEIRKAALQGESTNSAIE